MRKNKCLNVLYILTPLNVYFIQGIKGKHKTCFILVLFPLKFVVCFITNVENNQNYEILLSSLKGHQIKLTMLKIYSEYFQYNNIM